jgi:hypothetical protein
MGSKKVMDIMCVNQAFMRGILNEGTSMERGLSTIQTIEPIRGNGLKDYFPGMGFLRGQTATDIKESTKVDSSRGGVHFFLQMARSLEANGSKGSSMALENSRSITK